MVLSFWVELGAATGFRPIRRRSRTPPSRGQGHGSRNRVGGLRTPSTEKTAAAPQPATTGLAPAGKASGAALAAKVSTPEPPEVSFSSLPRAPILTHRAPVRAPFPAGDPAPVHARTAPSPSPAVEDIPAASPAPVHARTAPSQPEADTADLIPEPKATTEDAKPTPAPRARTQEAPPPAPGSLEESHPQGSSEGAVDQALRERASESR